MIKEVLYNKKDRALLKKELKAETFKRITCSFYRYTEISDVQSFRDRLYRDLSKINVFGRVYVAEEGVNAQISCPDHQWGAFRKKLNSYEYLSNVPVKRAVKDGQSFYKLTVKIKDQIVAYDVEAAEYDMGNVGRHLNASKFNQKLEQNNVVAVDMRNYYESEVGRFKNALIPDVDTSRELLPEVKKMLKGHEEDEILLYCTGGIRCEKASAYLIKNGFDNVSQLDGGIIQYAHEIEKNGLKSKFIGKNFVFDDRMGESITDDIIGSCHQCEKPSDTHIDCGNDACHILFIQCDDCNVVYNGCCSKECMEFASLPIEEQRILRKDPSRVVSKARYSSRIKPKLKEID